RQKRAANFALVAGHPRPFHTTQVLLVVSRRRWHRQPCPRGLRMIGVESSPIPPCPQPKGEVTRMAIREAMNQSAESPAAAAKHTAAEDQESKVRRQRLPMPFVAVRSDSYDCQCRSST